MSREKDVRLSQRFKEEAVRKQKAIMATSKIKRKYVILSGKGGVGKSVVTANLALALSALGLRGKVGILDTDVHGPSIPKYLGADSENLRVSGDKILPAEGVMGIKIVSASLMLQQKETPIIWRGPLKVKFVRDMLSEIDWSGIEVLLIDTPPGTGDELQAIVTYVNKITGGIVVTIPSDVSLHVVKRSVGFLNKMSVPTVGAIVNMSYVLCPDGSRHYVFGGGRERIENELGVPILAYVPVTGLLADPITPKKNPYENDLNEEPVKTFIEIAKKLLL